ncbi:unnamed protein product, partial [Notodromas monacha]
GEKCRKDEENKRDTLPMLEQYLRKLPFYEKTWFQFVLFVLRRFEADRCREQAGSLTYTTLFAVVPMLTTRGGIIGFMRYWTIISLGPILLGSAFVISSTMASLNVLSNNFAGYELDGAFVLWLISFCLTVVGFFILNWTIPNRSVPIKSALIAGLFSAVVFELLKNLFGFVMSNFTSYEIIYGAFAAIPIFLLWIFLSWNIVLIGVEISYALTAFTSHKEQKRHPVIMLLDLLELFYKKQQQGLSVSDDEALDVLGRDELGRWPSYVFMLEQQNLVKRTDDNQYVLVRNLSQVDFWSFYSKLPYPLPKRKDLGNVHPDDVWMQKIGP